MSRAPNSKTLARQFNGHDEKARWDFLLRTVNASRAGRRAARFWSAPVFWRFGRVSEPASEQVHGPNADPKAKRGFP